MSYNAGKKRKSISRSRKLKPKVQKRRKSPTQPGCGQLLKYECVTNKSCTYIKRSKKRRSYCKNQYVPK